MKKFAKLFETEIGQVLVIRTQDDETAPAIKIQFYAGVHGVGLCDFTISYTDDAAGNASADDAFESVDQELATNIGKERLEQIEGMYR